MAPPVATALATLISHRFNLPQEAPETLLAAPESHRYKAPSQVGV